MLFHRIASANTIDVYECCSIDGRHWDLLFLDMYHPRKSRKAPNGYTLAKNNFLLSGIDKEVSDFPRALYLQIVEYSQKCFAISIADPAVRLAIESTEFERPSSHVARLRKVTVQELTNEAISAQTAIYEQLTKLDIPRDQIRLPEITYFVLSLAILSLFRWGRSEDAEIMADTLSTNVLKLNWKADRTQHATLQVVKTYRLRFQEYRSILPSSSDGDWFGFGLRLSENLLGQKSALIGEILNGTTTIILVELKKLIEEIHR
jgi:hypothetical protein